MIMSPHRQKYLSKFKIFRHHLKGYIKYNGYLSGFSRLITIAIVGGLKNVYRQVLSYQKQYIYKVQDSSACRYVIFAPDFVSNSAGIYCLYKLCHDLRNKGYPAAIYGSTCTTETLDAPLISKKDMKKLRHHSDVWVVYPETVVGNPLDFKNVARWVLNRPGILGGDEIYDSEEKVFVYSNVYAPYVKNKIQGMLCIPTFDSSIFYPPKEEVLEQKRELACYYVGKSTFKEGHFDLTETFEITRESPAKKELGKLFRSAKVLYSFDNSTALIYEAIACGCPVQIIPDGTQTWEDYKKLEWGTTGIFWDKPADSLTLNDVTILLEKIKSRNTQYQDELNNFVKLTIGA